MISDLPKYQIASIFISFKDGNPDDWKMRSIYGAPNAAVSISIHNYHRRPNSSFTTLEIIKIRKNTKKGVNLTDLVAILLEWCRFHLGVRRNKTDASIEEIGIWIDSLSPLKLTRIEIRHDGGYPLALYPFYEREVYDTEPSIVEHMVTLFREVARQVEKQILKDRKS